MFVGRSQFSRCSRQNTWRNRRNHLYMKSRWNACVCGVQHPPVTQSQEGCRMRPERNSLIAIALLFMAGCSAHRQALQTDSVSVATDPVPIPIRHTGEYDFRTGDHEYDPYPSSGNESDPSRTPVPPPVPMQELVPAPPAIGISPVKSVSWLRGASRRSESSNCGEGMARDPGGIVPDSPTRFPPTPAIQKINRGIVKQIVQPPMWPRLGSAAAAYGNSPVVNPPVDEDLSLPAIQPGPRI